MKIRDEISFEKSKYIFFEYEYNIQENNRDKQKSWIANLNVKSACFLLSIPKARAGHLRGMWLAWSTVVGIDLPVVLPPAPGARSPRSPLPTISLTPARFTFLKYQWSRVEELWSQKDIVWNPASLTKSVALKKSSNIFEHQIPLCITWRYCVKWSSFDCIAVKIVDTYVITLHTEAHLHVENISAMKKKLMVKKNKMMKKEEEDE